MIKGPPPSPIKVKFHQNRRINEEIDVFFGVSNAITFKQYFPDIKYH